MQAENLKGTILSFRNDRMGARLMTLFNTIRIAHDYDMDYAFAWKMDAGTSEELLNPKQIFDGAYFDAHHLPLEEFRKVQKTASDVQLLPRDCSSDDFKAKIAEGAPLLCQGSNLIVLPWEKPEDVAPRYAAAIQAFKFNPEVTAAMRSVDETLSGAGTAFHIRRGDIIYHPITSNQLWSNKYIPREFYEVLAERLVEYPKTKILIFSDEPEEITRLKSLGPQILGAADVIPASLTIAQRDFIELYAMSRCRSIYGPPGSGFSMTAALMGNGTVEDVREQLSDQENNAAMDRLVGRLKKEQGQFLGDGDIGQSLPFAIDHLNATNRGGTALKILQGLAKRGFCKLYFFKLLMRQYLIAGHFESSEKIIKSFANAEIDRSIPGRLEGHWAEVNRLSVVAAAHLDNKTLTTQRLATSLWYAAAHRPTINLLCQLCASGLIDPKTFPIPFDPAASRPVPSQMTAVALAREGHPALLPPDLDHPQWIIPTDIIAYDWRIFLGKNLGRGFGQPEMVRRSAELFHTQFARHMAPDVVASVDGLYSYIEEDYATANTHMETALATQPKNPLWLKRSALIRYAMDPTDLSVAKTLETAAEISGAGDLYQAQLADYYWNNKKRPLGLRIMQDICEREIQLPELAFITAQMMRVQKKSGPEALKLVNQALKLAPDVRRFMSLKAHILFDMEDVSRGKDYIDTIVARFGEAGDVKNLRARAEAA